MQLEMFTDPLREKALEVCGKRTKKKSMSWEAEEAWNAHEYDEQQLSMF